MYCDSSRPLRTQDILASSVLLAGCTAGAVAAAVVVHQLVQSDSGTPEDDEDNLYRAVTGIAVSYIIHTECTAS